MLRHGMCSCLHAHEGGASQCTCVKEIKPSRLIYSSGVGWPQAYFQRVRRAMNAEGGVFVMDLLGGHEAESAVAIPRHNAVTGAAFLWEQEAYDPVTRHIRCHITLRDPATRKARAWLVTQFLFGYP